MKKVIDLLTEAWHEVHGQKTYFIAFGIAVYLIAAMSTNKLDGTLGTIFFLFDILITMIFHELFMEVRRKHSPDKTSIEHIISPANKPW